MNIIINTRKLKQALNHGFVLKKVHRVIKFNQKAWLKSCIEMNPELKIKKLKMTSKKIFFKLMNNSSFGKTTENVKEHTCNDRTCHNRKRKKLFGVRTKLS